MDWDDVDEILFEGTVEQISAVRCPECDGQIEYEFDDLHHTFTIRCRACDVWSKACKVIDRPICTTLYGDNAIIRGRPRPDGEP